MSIIIKLHDDKLGRDWWLEWSTICDWFPRVDARFCPVCGASKPERVGDHAKARSKWTWKCCECASVFVTVAEGAKP